MKQGRAERNSGIQVVFCEFFFFGIRDVMVFLENFQIFNLKERIGKYRLAVQERYIHFAGISFGI